MVKVTESNFDAAAAETDPGYGQLFAVLMRRRFGYWVYYVVFCLLPPS